MNNVNMKNILIATLISFIFFAVYDYFVIQPQMAASENNATVKQNTVKESVNKTKINNPIKNKTKIIVEVVAKNYEVKIDSLGRISSFKLDEKKFNKDGKKLELTSVLKPLELRFSNEKVNEEAFKVSYTSDKNLVKVNDKATITLTQKLPEITIQKIITFYKDGHYDLKVKLSKNMDYFITPGSRPSAAIDKLTIHGVLIKKNDGKLKIIDDGDAEEETVNNATVIAGFDRYYTTLFFSKEPLKTIVYPDSEKNAEVFINTDKNLNLTGYIGPKYVDTLASINKELIDVVQYGVGTFFARNLFILLDFLYKAVGNWGIAIILLVIIVRIILFPLTFKGMVSMYKLKELAPKMKELQLKYKKDPQKLQMHMMKLYKEHGANPLGGCLPLVLQIPIFYGIYKLLLYSIELKGASFLWIYDLSSMDPYFILPVLMGITMFLQQKITPTNFQDPMQEKIFKFLPLIFTFMMATFPAGLVLYWTTNNILSILQQYIINKLMEKKSAHRI
ncbi:YidC/Oxa1 family membrane protein insertase [Lebetimonas natsushimae]|uniref:Membrane protein insertase YidC n=1 Tax=Lebetimonas natsushimae TaxID=1936991 RepID=A0A292YH24_9BACT|nr:membrane protein insertase YidC [Lebetimonas natsushimae]GAX88120.1 YidC/Oxa1 family membrane protein insertase [Lebetimonas natsushimae]